VSNSTPRRSLNACSCIGSIGWNIRSIGNAIVRSPTSSDPSHSGDVSFRAEIASITTWKRDVGAGITLMNST